MESSPMMASLPQEENTSQNFFEDHLAKVQDLPSLKNYLRHIAESTGNGKLELNEENDRKTTTEIGEILRTITAVANNEAGYSIKMIPGLKLREAVDRILRFKESEA